MSNAKPNSIVYARVFFLTDPDVSLLMPGETRRFPIKYIRGNPAATAFRLDWYASRLDADARQNRFTNAARLPTAQVVPAIPNADARPETLQDGTVLLTAPAANGYANPVGVILMVQETETIPPYLYLLSDEIVMPTEVTEYAFKYRVGDPPATAFHLEWYATRLDANLQVRQLTDTDRLPRAEFIPTIPKTDADSETFQDGVLRLYPPVSDTPYRKAVGLLCMVQGTDKKTVRPLQICPITVSHPRDYCPPDQELYLDSGTLNFVGSESIDLDLTKYTNGHPTVLSKPDFLTLDGTFLIGTMPVDEEDEIYEIKLESQLGFVQTGSLYIRRITGD